MGDDASDDDAREVLRYLGARSTVTARAVRRLGEAARAQGLRVAATTLASLQANEAAGEYWTPVVGAYVAESKSLELLQYLYGRGGYGLNHLSRSWGKLTMPYQRLGSTVSCSASYG